MKNVKYIMAALILAAYLIGGILLMTDKTYGYCGSKCKHEIYTKDDYAVFEGNFPVLNKAAYENSVWVNYPEGFTKENTVVISKMHYDLLYSSDTYYTDSSTGVTTIDGVIEVFLNDDEIQINLTNKTKSTFSDIKYKVVLLKYKD